MLTLSDIAQYTEFDCYCCRPIISCNTVGCAVDYECDDCPDQMKNVCKHIGTYCRPVYFSRLAYDIIMDGWNYELSPNYNRYNERKYSDIILSV